MTSVKNWFHSKYFKEGTFKIKNDTSAEERRKLETVIAAWQSPPVKNLMTAKEIANLLGEEL